MQPLPLQHIPHIPQRQRVLARLSILCEDILKFLRDEAAFVIVRVCIAAVFRFVDVGGEDAEEGVGEVGGLGRVGEVEVDDQGGDGGEDPVEAEFVETDERVERPDHAVTVGIEEIDVLLQDLDLGRQRKDLGGHVYTELRH